MVVYVLKASMKPADFMPYSFIVARDLFGKNLPLSESKYISLAHEEC